MSGKTIQINPDILIAVAAELDAAKNELKSNALAEPLAHSGGQTIQEMRAISNDYMEIERAIERLIDKTKQFLTQSAADTKAMDNAIAGKMKLGE